LETPYLSGNYLKKSMKIQREEHDGFAVTCTFCYGSWLDSPFLFAFAKSEFGWFVLAFPSPKLAGYGRNRGNS
jgi:hypothetical protein